MISFQSGSLVSSTTSNPGFLRGANLIARIVNGATIEYALNDCSFS
jgi:hypothetical protein